MYQLNLLVNTECYYYYFSLVFLFVCELPSRVCYSLSLVLFLSVLGPYVICFASLHMLCRSDLRLLVLPTPTPSSDVVSILHLIRSKLLWQVIITFGSWITWTIIAIRRMTAFWVVHFPLQCKIHPL